MGYNSKLVGLATITTKPNKNPIFDGIWGRFLALFSCALIGADNTHNNESIRMKDIRSFEKRVKALRIFYRKRSDVYDVFSILDPEKLIEFCKLSPFFRQQKQSTVNMFKKFHYQPSPNDPYFGEIQPKTPKVNHPKKRLLVGFHRLFHSASFWVPWVAKERIPSVDGPRIQCQRNDGIFLPRGHTWYAMVMSVKWVFGMR